ncbi:MAG: OmpW family protein [Proteobacteria bacterium]|nr:OmpW family protein [Pseudomonadota bacterium]
MKTLTLALAAATVALGLAQPAAAGDYNGNFMVRLQGTYVDTQDHLKSLTSVSGAPVSDLKGAGFDASVTNEWIPTATLTYFLNKNIGVELFCCFSKHGVDLSAPPAFAALSGRVADAWIFPPALTLQYHFDGLGPFKPYVGAGVQYIHYFDTGTGSNTLQSSGVKFSDSFGPTLQIGFDYAIGGGWYLNADVKKSWLSTTATWANSAVTGGDIKAKVDVDPLIVSVGVGYRFNLEDIFGHRSASYEPLK